jgi:hypothetical protein
MKYINYPRVHSSCEKALRALDCGLDVGAGFKDAEKAYAMLTTVDAAALHRRIEVTGNVAPHTKSEFIKKVFGTTFNDRDDAFDVMLAERLGETLAMLQLVGASDDDGHYAAVRGHIATATTLLGARLAATHNDPVVRREAHDMLQRALAYSDDANKALRDLLNA